MWLFFYFNFERNYDVLKSKSKCPCIFLNTNIDIQGREIYKAEKLVPDLFLFFEKHLYEVKASGLHLSFNIF